VSDQLILVIVGVIGLSTVLAVIVVLRNAPGRVDARLPGGRFFAERIVEKMPGIRARKIRSRSGGVRIDDNTGRGADVTRVEAETDVSIRAGGDAANQDRNGPRALPEEQ
jgi:hypothetical protein